MSLNEADMIRKGNVRESGDAMRLALCESCEVKNAPGIAWVQGGGLLVFRCDLCGKMMSLGYTELSAALQRQDRWANEGQQSRRRDRDREQKARADEELQKQFPHMWDSSPLWAYRQLQF